MGNGGSEHFHPFQEIPINPRWDLTCQLREGRVLILSSRVVFVIFTLEKNMRLRLFALPILALSLSACASVSLERSKIVFIDSKSVLPYDSAEPTAAEKEGVLLRLKHSKKTLTYEDVIQIFAQVEGDTAIPLKMNKKRVVTYTKGDTPDVFKSTVETFAQNGEKLGEESFLETPLGEIAQFQSGELESDSGKITILSHTRGAMLPAKKVRVGDKWSYEETLETKVDGTWVSRTSDAPTKIKVDCRLIGFAVMDGHRCAVIAVKTASKGLDKYSAFWKQYSVRVGIYAKETILFDYERGLELGNVIRGETYSVAVKGEFSDYSKSLAISKLVDDATSAKSEEKKGASR